MRTMLRHLRLLPLAVLAAAASAAEPAVPAVLNLQTAVNYALQNNFAIRQARERIRQQEGVLLEIGARELPSAGVTGNYQRSAASISQAFPPSSQTWGISISVSQTLYAGGGVRASVLGARHLREAAVLDLQVAINDALLDVRTAWYGVLLARERIKVQEETIVLLRRQLQTATDRFEAGAVSSFERLRAEVSLANAQVPLITARNEFRLAVERMRQVLGFTLNTPETLRQVPEFDGALSYTAAPAADLQASFQAAHARRPELQRLARLTEAQQEAVKAARATGRPNVSLVGGWSLRRGATDSFSDSDRGAFVGLQSQWSIFDGRATTGRVRQAVSAAEQARLRLTEAQLAVEVEVRRAVSSLQEAAELVEASQKVVAQAEEAVRLATSRYDAGSATQLDVLQSQVDLTTARTNQLLAVYNHNVALAALRKATGTADEYVAAP